MSGVLCLLQSVVVMLFRIESSSTGPSLIPFVRGNPQSLEIVGPESQEDGDGAADVVGVPLVNYPLLEHACFTGWIEEQVPNGHYRQVWPIRWIASGMASELLVTESTKPLPEAERDAVTHFLGFYGNYLNLLDYSELDTLTGLSNRKTYDEALDRIMAAIPNVSRLREGVERRSEAEKNDKSFWLGVVDIDHFKRINDSFGHLFGDEVLLRIANLMKSSFRTSDKLFRFGGEEFVVVLRPTLQENAERAFERFREAVEVHEFPQIGQVTCSIGFTRIDPSRTPTDTLGHADEALYFSKENGRNQVNCYELLVAKGLLDLKSIEASLPDMDIDALFA